MSLARAWLAIAALLWLSACSNRPAGEETLRLWVIGREGEVVAELLPEFEARHPGVHVRLQQLPWSAAHEKLLTAYAGDALPDIMQLGNTWVPEFALLGALEPLDERVAGSASISAGDYFDGIWATNTYAGRLYGIPWYVDTRLLFYRRDILTAAGHPAPPRDWREWQQAMAAVKRLRPQDYAILLPLDEYAPLVALALQQPEPMLAANDSRGNFRGAGFRRALDFYAEAFRQGWAPRMSETQISNVWNEFGRGYFAFYISGPWQIGEFRRRLPAERQGDWATAPLPGPDGPGASTAGGSSLVIGARSPHKTAAWQLIEFLSEPERQRRLTQLTGNLPPRRSTWAYPELAADPALTAFRDQLERVRATPKVAEWERIVVDMQFAAERVSRAGADPDVVLTALDHQVDALLEKRRWLLEKKP
jgi:multiple sugar transport system substrate-binding protein